MRFHHHQLEKVKKHQRSHSSHQARAPREPGGFASGLDDLALCLRGWGAGGRPGVGAGVAVGVRALGFQCVRLARSPLCSSSLPPKSNISDPMTLLRTATRKVSHGGSPDCMMSLVCVWVDGWVLCGSRLLSHVLPFRVRWQSEHFPLVICPSTCTSSTPHAVLSGAHEKGRVVRRWRRRTP